MAELYAIVDPERCAGRDPIVVAGAVLDGGCAVLQLRCKRLADRERLALARAIGARVRAHGARFVINDRADLAVLAGADALHLGQGDLAIADARRIVGLDMPIDRSTHDLAQALAAVEEGASAIGLGPVFETQSKESPDPIVGVERLAEVVRAVQVPVIAIGGITHARARAIHASGAAYAAVISALGEAADPRAEARALVAALRGEAS